MKWLPVNVILLPLKAHYSFLFGGLCCWTSFGPTIMKQLGYSPSSVGLVFSVSPLFATICKVTFSILGDKLYKAKFILVANILVTAVINMIIYFIPGPPLDKVQLQCGPLSTIVQLQNPGIAKQVQIADILRCESFAQESNNELDNICHDWYKNSHRVSITPKPCREFKANISIIQVQTNTSIVRGLLQSVECAHLEPLVTTCSSPRNATSYIICEQLQREGLFTGEQMTIAFWLLFSAHMIYSAGACTSYVMTDTACYQLLGDKPERYGKQRMVGSLGYGISSIITGLLVDYFSGGGIHTKNYLPMFLFSSVLLLFSAACCSMLNVRQNPQNDYKWSNVVALFVQIDAVLLLFWAFVYGGFTAITWQYTYWYLEQIADYEQAKYVKSLQGLCGFMSAFLGDALTFFFAGKVIKKVGIKNLMSPLLILYGIKSLTLSYISSPLLIIPICWVDGLLYGFCWTIVTTYAAEVASAGTETTVQSIFGCVFDGLGTSAGGLIGGFLYNAIGGAKLFNWCSIVAFVTAILHLICRFVSHVLN